MNTVKDLPSWNADNHRPEGYIKYSHALPYEQVKKIIKPYHFSSVPEYTEWVRDLRSRGLGQGLPMNPNSTYLRRGEWVSSKDFLGIPAKEETKEYRKWLYENEKQTVVQQSHPSLSTIIKQILGIRK